MSERDAQQRDAMRIRATLLTIILVAGLLAVGEAGLAVQTTSLGLWALALGTGLFSAVLARPYWLSLRGRDGQAVLETSLAILGIQTVYLLLYPRAYPAIAIASTVIVALALSFVRGRALFAIVFASWAVAMAAILVGVFGHSSVDIPASADTLVVLGSGLAAVTVAMVLLWQFAHHMTEALGEAQAANDRLQAAHEKLKDLERLKSRFINSAAHELNTPLTPLVLQLQLLKQGLAESSTAQRKSLQVVERNLDRIVGLVREMLDVARIQAGRLGTKHEGFDLRAAVGEAVDDYEAIAQDAGVALTFVDAPDATVAADKRHLAQILSNLLSNAIRLTPRGGTVDVSLRSEGASWVVRVKDSGPGLTREQFGGLFQPFARLHDDAVGGKGTGLGLYISKSLAEAMGGELWAESAGAGQGATFGLRLLRDAPQLPAATPVLTAG